MHPLHRCSKCRLYWGGGSVFYLGKQLWINCTTLLKPTCICPSNLFVTAHTSFSKGAVTYDAWRHCFILTFLTSFIKPLVNCFCQRVNQFFTALAERRSFNYRNLAAIQRCHQCCKCLQTNKPEHPVFVRQQFRTCGVIYIICLWRIKRMNALCYCSCHRPLVTCRL